MSALEAYDKARDNYRKLVDQREANHRQCPPFIIEDRAENEWWLAVEAFNLAMKAEPEVFWAATLRVYREYVEKLREAAEEEHQRIMYGKL